MVERLPWTSIDINICFVISQTIPTALLSSGISPIFSSTVHNIELLLQTELPLIASAFKMSGYTPSQVKYGNRNMLQEEITVNIEIYYT